MVYLVKYTFDQKYVSDTCKNIKNGFIQFKGDKTLDKGVYTLVSQGRSIYFDFFINENQKFQISTDIADVMGSLRATGSKENEQFFSYISYVTGKNKDFGKIREQTKGKNKADSIVFMTEKLKVLNADVKAFEAKFMTDMKGTFVYDVLNLKTEKTPTLIPKASNGRPDSLYQYYYYKNHYFDGINFKDERIVRTPFFDTRIKKYFDNVIVSHPDTIIQEIDKLLTLSEPGNIVHTLLLGYFTHKYEQSKIMGFDKIFVHLADTYIISGKAKDIYSEETVAKIKERVDILRNLLLDAKVADLYMIDTTAGKDVRKMGFDTASSSAIITKLYYNNIERLTPMFKTLYEIKSKYTILVFWAVDCGHCQTEIPELHEDLKVLKNKIDYSVFAVQTKDDLFDTWRKFIIEKKLSDFNHVYDPIHINNLKDRFDIYSTPVIYILDKEKRIKAKRIGAEQVVEVLNALELRDNELYRKEK